MIAIVQWLASNWPALLSVVAMVLGVGVAVAHLMHRDSVADSIQKVEDVVNKLNPPK